MSIFKNQYVYYIVLLIVLSLLTFFPFFLVIEKVFSKNISYFLVMLCLITQVLLQVKFFLHLGFSISEKWRTISMIFTVIISIIILSGSIWIMKNLNNHLCFL